VAWAFPLGVTMLVLAGSLRANGDMTDIATTLLGAMMYRVAVPTAWIFAVDFIEAGRLLGITATLATSLPLWYFVGARLAEFSYRWSDWVRRYIVFCLVWSALNVGVIVVVGSLTG
jgi:hypothetical protein